nr:MAG TPA: Single strand binding protein [Caudoviricetes sp.]
MNKVALMGRLTRAPEIRFSNSQNPVEIANFSLAVNRRYKRDGEPDADFFDCVAFGKTAEVLEKYVAKGNQIGIVGRLQSRTWEDQEGRKRKAIEVVVEELDFCGSKKESQSTGRQEEPASAPAAEGMPEGFFPVQEGAEDEDLPF